MPKLTFYVSEAMKKDWKRVPLEERLDIGLKVRSLIRRRLEKAQNGKPLPPPATRATSARIGSGKD